LKDDAIQELLGGARWFLGDLFVDSGAFGEVEMTPSGPRVVHPISAREWGRRMRLAVELAERWGPRLWLVTPDRVGCQRTTLGRLVKFRRAVQACHVRGARLVFPVQRGRWSMAAFWAGSVEAAGLSVDLERLVEGRILPGIPSKKDATPLHELAAFAEVRAEANAARGAWLYWHLLGCGPRSRGYGQRVEAICSAWGQSVVSSDSVLLRAIVGRAGKGRPLTRARDEVVAEGEAVGVVQVKRAALERYDDGERARRLERAKAAGWAERMQLDLELTSAPAARRFLNCTGRKQAGCSPGRTARRACPA